MSNRLDQKSEAELQPQRIKYAKEQLLQRNIKILVEDNVKIIFEFKGKRVTLYPYSGWHSGRTVVDGRGIDKLLKQIDDYDKINGRVKL